MFIFLVTSFSLSLAANFILQSCVIINLNNFTDVAFLNIRNLFGCSIPTGTVGGIVHTGLQLSMKQKEEIKLSSLTETLYLGCGSEISHYFIAGVNVGLFGGRNGKITIGLNVPFAFGHVLPQRKSLEIQYIKICIIFVSCNCVRIVNSKMSKYLFDC